MEVMKRLLLVCTLAAATLCAADLSGVHTVYLLPMAKGLDQYLANRLINDGMFQVVTDPTKADAIFTDRIGEGFEQKMSELFPPPEPPKVEEKKVEEKAPADAHAGDTKPTDARGDAGPGEEPLNKLAKVGGMGGFSRPKGTVFLVNTKSRLVLWSAYEPPKDGTDKQLDHTASLLVGRLKKLSETK
jgi:hypothetical protein